MPSINEFITGFGWPEFIITLIVTLTIVIIRERHHFLKKPNQSNTQSAE